MHARAAQERHLNGTLIRNCLIDQAPQRPVGDVAALEFIVTWMLLLLVHF
jgi:hypothetical protein